MNSKNQSCKKLLMENLHENRIIPIKHTYKSIAKLQSSCYNSSMKKTKFEWDENKNSANKEKHSVSFEEAQHAFADVNRVIAQDIDHSSDEKRYFCFGAVGGDILTVRFTYRENIIRIFGAGYWRKGKQTYEQKN